MNDAQRIESLILLVGSNPVPNYLAAMALKPSTIYLVHTAETEKPMGRLRDAIRRDLSSNVAIDGDPYISDPFNAAEVDRTIRDLLTRSGAAHLHYTGGTKVMSAHALKAFCKNGGTPANASYLDEAKRRLRFDGDLPDRQLADCGATLTMDRILQLHGITQKPRSPISGGPARDDVQEIATAVLKRPQLASCLYGEKERLEQSFSDAKASPSTLSDYGMNLNIRDLPPKEGMNKKCFDAWCKFIGGTWLELWAAAMVDSLQLEGKPEIAAGVNCTRDETGRPFEVDVGVIRGDRPYFISCTTDMTRDRCKSKTFEILVRARHMGGDLARSALVSLLPSHLVADLQNDVADAWKSTNVTRVFGLEDLRAWAGHYGSPDTSELRKWLES